METVSISGQDLLRTEAGSSTMLYRIHKIENMEDMLASELKETSWKKEAKLQYTDSIDTDLCVYKRADKGVTDRTYIVLPDLDRFGMKHPTMRAGRVPRLTNKRIYLGTFADDGKTIQTHPACLYLSVKGESEAEAIAIEGMTLKQYFVKLSEMQQTAFYKWCEDKKCIPPNLTASEAIQFHYLYYNSVNPSEAHKADLTQLEELWKVTIGTSWLMSHLFDILSQCFAFNSCTLRLSATWLIETEYSLGLICTGSSAHIIQAKHVKSGEKQSLLPLWQLDSQEADLLVLAWDVKEARGVVLDPGEAFHRDDESETSVMDASPAGRTAVNEKTNETTEPHETIAGSKSFPTIKDDCQVVKEGKYKGAVQYWISLPSDEFDEDGWEEEDVDTTKSMQLYDLLAGGAAAGGGVGEKAWVGTLVEPINKVFGGAGASLEVNDLQYVELM